MHGTLPTNRCVTQTNDRLYCIIESSAVKRVAVAVVLPFSCHQVLQVTPLLAPGV
jgi:hypothetical protein